MSKKDDVATADDKAAGEEAEVETEEVETEESPQLFSDADVARVRKSSLATGRKKVLGDLGVENLAEAQALIEEARRTREAGMSELEKEKAALERERREAEIARKEARQTTIENRLARALRTSNGEEPACREDRVEDVVRFLISSVLNADDDDIADVISDATSDARVRWPEWFGANSDEEADTRGRPPATPQRRGGERGMPKPDPSAKIKERYEALRSAQRIPSATDS